MTWFLRTKPVSPGSTKISCHKGSIRIQNPLLFGASEERWQSFVERLVAIPEVQTVEIDRKTGTASIHFATDQTSHKRLLEQMSGVLAAPASTNGRRPFAGLDEHLAGRRRITLHRRGDTFSVWQLMHVTRGRIRVRDTGLRGQVELVRKLELELHTLPGVRTVAASASSGSVVIWYDPSAIPCDNVLALMDDAVQSTGLASARGIPPKASFTLANTALVLATVGEFMFPAVLPASALLLVGVNLPTIIMACKDLRHGRLGLPILQTSIVAATLASSGFIASSLMSWLLLFWQNRHARRVATARQILGATVRKHNRTAWVSRDGVDLETPVEHLQPGDILTIRPGESLPVDGKILSGTAMVDESLVRGSDGLVCRTIEQTILRGSLVVEGDLRVQVIRCGQDTVAERIGQALDAATHDTSLSIKQAPPTIAKRAVPPVLLTAGVGLMVGDVTTAGAILRPDYASGPGMGNSLMLVHQLGACLHAGLIVRKPSVFSVAARVDMVLVDWQPALERRHFEIERISTSGPFTEDELLQYADCGLRGICDSRSTAVSAACASRNLSQLDLPAACQAGGVELWDRGRQIRIAGDAALPLGQALSSDSTSIGSLEIMCDGQPVGSVTFRPTARLAAEPALTSLRTDHRLQVGLLAQDDGTETRNLVEALGIDFHQVCASDEAKARYIEECRQKGHRVAYVGDCLANPLAAQAADVSIAPVADPGLESDPAEVWMLQGDYSRLAALFEVARSSRRQMQMQNGMTLIPNLACVAGAFFFGFTSLAAVVISNLGTYTVYRRSVKALGQTERRLLSRRLPMQRLRLDSAASNGGLPAHRSELISATVTEDRSMSELS